MHPSMLHAASSLINYEEIELSFMWISHCDAGGLLGLCPVARMQCLEQTFDAVNETSEMIGEMAECL